MRTGHLFAGIDGLGLGLERHGFDTAWYSEYEDAPSRVLARHYPEVPNHGDITTIDWTQVEPVDALTGGFPCQDLSYAGKGAGIAEGTRSGLWFEYVRAIRALRPRIVIVENVPALTTRGLDIVLRDLHEGGFDAEWSTLRASDVGAAHRRERLFIVAVARDATGDERDVCRRIGRGYRPDQGTPGGTGRATADPGGDGLVRGEEPHVGTQQPGQQPSRRRDPERLDQTATDGVGVRSERRGEHRHLAGTTRTGEADGGQRERHGDAADHRRPTDWGEFGPAIRRWERTIGRPAPAPTVDGRLSPEFVEWHMGFPAGWTDILTRTQRLKALGNAVVPQVADVIGRWAVELAGERMVA